MNFSFWPFLWFGLQDFHTFSHFFTLFQTFSPRTFPFKAKGFSSMRTKEKRKKHRTNRCCTLVVARFVLLDWSPAPQTLTCVLLTGGFGIPDGTEPRESGKSKRGLNKWGLGPKGTNWAKKAPFGAISALRRSREVRRTWSRSASKGPQLGLEGTNQPRKGPIFHEGFLPDFLKGNS